MNEQLEQTVPRGIGEVFPPVAEDLPNKANALAVLSGMAIVATASQYSGVP